MPAVIDLYFDGIAYVIQTSTDDYFACLKKYFTTNKRRDRLE